MNHEDMLKKREWLLSARGQELIHHAGRQHFLQDEMIQDEMNENKIIYRPVPIATMTIVDVVKELELFCEIWNHLTDQTFDFDVQDPLPKLKVQLKYFYSPEAHSLLLRWIGEILATPSSFVSTKVQKEYTEDQMDEETFEKLHQLSLDD